ncbi:ubx domain-containing protein 11 [Lynx pardinus]|uniref:Ubx domain-containing protein 11 n=1 Tax=Lynx pardinus TaxID=191816 RepID=A0A485NUC9_LYNPA|nr:ubx domain-containing protein 11 [Lynx pardinus]
MSSPLASLGKTRRVPLESEPVNPGRRGIKIYGDEDEVDMLNDGRGSEERISVPSCYGGIGAPVSRQVPVFHDSELVATLSRKLRDLEQQVKAQTDELLSKDRKIRALEEMLQTLREHQGKGHSRWAGQPSWGTSLGPVAPGHQGSKSIKLSPMRFLSDYGLQWVGEPEDQEDSEDNSDSEDGNTDWMTAKKFWKPGDSLAPPEVDFDRLLASLKDLSELVVEGDTQVTPMPGGARLHVLEPIPLKLYRNGLMMFDGPFRPTAFTLPSCQVSDLRNQVYPENRLELFPGEGRVVGWQRIHKPVDRMEPPGSRMTAEKFLNRLPKFVIRRGEVIDIRGPIRDTLQNCCPLPARIQEIVVETPALAAERERSQESPESQAPLLSMLRIKSENGEQAFLLMMRPEDTVGDVRTLLAQARAVDATTFEIISTFPPTVYHDDTVTLQQPRSRLPLRDLLKLFPTTDLLNDSGQLHPIESSVRRDLICPHREHQRSGSGRNTDERLDLPKVPPCCCLGNSAKHPGLGSNKAK